MVAADARHLERIGDAAAGFERQVLQVAIDVVMGDKHRVSGAKFASDSLLQLVALGQSRIVFMGHSGRSAACRRQGSLAWRI